MGYSFPEDVLEHILSFITSDKDRNVVSLVCKSWYEIERRCRRRIYVGNCYAVAPRIVTSRFPDLRSVELKGKPLFVNFNLVPGGYVYPWIVDFSRAYPWLEEIRLKRMVVSDESLELISKSFTRFKVLVLSYCQGFSADGLAAIAANCRNLRKLDLCESEVEDLSEHWLSHFPDTFTSLEFLNIDCLESEVSFSTLERLVARSPNLKTLRLNHAVPLDKLAKLLHRVPQLVDLGTGNYSGDFQPDIYSSLAEAFSCCKQLKGLSGFLDAVPSYLPAVYSVCSRLTSLNLRYSSIQNPDLTKIISQCHNLQRLFVLDYIEDTGLNVVALSCKDLRELKVGPSEPFLMDANVSLTEQGLVSVCEGCPKLQSILYFCRQMSNSALFAVAMSRPNLNCFQLCIPQAPDYLTFKPLDAGFGAIVEHCKELRHLSIYGFLTDRVFEYIGTHGKNLEILSISHAGESDLGLHHVFSGCDSLRKLEIRDCPFGDKALLANVAKLETMRSLWMSSCLVSFGACKLLRQMMPWLNVEVSDESNYSDSRSDNRLVEKLCVYRTVAGPRFRHA